MPPWMKRMMMGELPFTPMMDESGDGDSGAGGGGGGGDPFHTFQFDGEDVSITSPEDIDHFAQTAGSTIDELKAEITQLKQAGGGDQLKNIEALLTKHGFTIKDEPGGKPKGSGGKDEPKYLTREEAENLFAQQKKWDEVYGADRQKAIDFLKENEIDLPIEKVEAYADSRNIDRLEDAAYLMTREDVRKKAEALGRSKGQGDAAGANRTYNRSAPQTKQFTRQDLQNMSQEDLDKVHRQALEEKNKQA